MKEHDYGFDDIEHDYGLGDIEQDWGRLWEF